MPFTICDCVCFLNKSWVFADQPGNELHVGQILQCVVRSIDKTRKVVYLSSDQDTVSSSVVISMCICLLHFFFSVCKFPSSL